MKKALLSGVIALVMMLALLGAAAFAESLYTVSTSDELKTALDAIAAGSETKAVIVLTGDVQVLNATDGKYTFGVPGKHITVRSEGEMKEFSFPGYGILKGDCTFDNVDVTGRRLFCNGYNTVFTENGQIHLEETLYGGGYKTTVASTHVVIAASGYINPSSNSGLHDVIGGSYQNSVDGDTYLEITGDIQMQGGNHVNPGCMTGDGSSGDGRNSPDVYVRGNATLIYDNKNSEASPAIEGTYGCEMRGNVTLDIRAGGVSGIVGTEEPADKSIIRGDLHIIAGSPDYENTDRILRLNGNWPISGTCDLGSSGNYAIGGNITIDAYENVWGWDRNTKPTTYDLPEIYGALRGDVGGNITINAHGSHVANIYGASDSVVQKGVTINATDVELRSSFYGTKYDDGYIMGLWERGIPSTANGSVTINIDGGDVGLVMATDQETVPAGSSINVTGRPNIRNGLRGTQATQPSSDFPVANIDGCTATIPFIKMMSQVNVINHSDVTAHMMSSDAGLMVEKGSKLTTDNGQVWIWGNAVIDGTWEQKHSQTANYNDIFIQGTTEIGADGYLINHGTSNLKGDVTNDGVMALMEPALLQGNYQAKNGELRLPAVVYNYNEASIPVEIQGLASGTTTVNTVAVAPKDWTKLQRPKLGDNYIVALKGGDAPAQSVFLLGNEDALREDWFLKRKEDLDDPNNYYMWQVATGISVTFDKNGGDTEANPNRMTQEQNPNGNHFELPSVPPTREGYEFTGWNTKADGTGAAFTAETEVKQSLTVYAQWTRKQIEKEDTISVTVKKVWKLNDGGTATDSVTVALYKNGNMDRTAVLSDANRWTYTWDDLSAKDAWTVEEPEVPNGFKAVVERKGSVFTITNDDIRVDVPQTGDKSHWLLWTVLLLASGLGITQCVRKGKGKIE